LLAPHVGVSGQVPWIVVSGGRASSEAGGGVMCRTASTHGQEEEHGTSGGRPECLKNPMRYSVAAQLSSAGALIH
jgi:hypothetical protein